MNYFVIYQHEYPKHQLWGDNYKVLEIIPDYDLNSEHKACMKLKLFVTQNPESADIYMRYVIGNDIPER